jgi:hypothetical protein
VLFVYVGLVHVIVELVEIVVYYNQLLMFQLVVLLHVLSGVYGFEICCFINFILLVVSLTLFAMDRFNRVNGFLVCVGSPGAGTFGRGMLGS